jgi:hypothetical protein
MPNTKTAERKATSAASQLLSCDQGRNDNDRETGVTDGKVDVQKQSPKTSIAARKPATRPTATAFLKFGYMHMSVYIRQLLRVSVKSSLSQIPFRLPSAVGVFVILPTAANDNDGRNRCKAYWKY